MGTKNREFLRVKALLACFGVLCVMTLTAMATASARLPDTIARPLTATEQAEIISRNSGLTDYVYLSPNADFPRTDDIKKITIHHMAADLTLEGLGDTFGMRERGASSNYAIDSSGRVALYVEESNRAWTSSSPENDRQAVTIEVANDKIGGEWHVSDEAFESLIALCADICERNGIEELSWTGDDSGNLTVHKMFNPETECPGPYLLSKMPEIAARVNQELRSANFRRTCKPAGNKAA